MGHNPEKKNTKMAKECPAEILKKFEEHGFEADWVKGEYAIFIGNYPSGKATKAQVMDRLKTAASERFPNAVPQNVADALYPAFDQTTRARLTSSPPPRVLLFSSQPVSKSA